MNHSSQVPTVKDDPLIIGELTGKPGPNGERLIKVLCPFCGKHHTHGWPDPNNRTPAHRLSHCWGKHKAQSYCITPDPDAFSDKEGGPS